MRAGSSAHWQRRRDRAQDCRSEPSKTPSPSSMAVGTAPPADNIAHRRWQPRSAASPKVNHRCPQAASGFPPWSTTVSITPLLPRERRLGPGPTPPCRPATGPLAEVLPSLPLMNAACPTVEREPVEWVGSGDKRGRRISGNQVHSRAQATSRHQRASRDQVSWSEKLFQIGLPLPSRLARHRSHVGGALDEGKQCARALVENQRGSVAILNIGGMDCNAQQQTERRSVLLVIGNIPSDRCGISIGYASYDWAPAPPTCYAATIQGG
jgi:hypothetical protein